MLFMVADTMLEGVCCATICGSSHLIAIICGSRVLVLGQSGGCQGLPCKAWVWHNLVVRVCVCVYCRVAIVLPSSVASIPECG